ncbi:MAG TPA: adenosine deaminase [Candidatus Dormibacteraeota bacterium]
MLDTTPKAELHVHLFGAIPPAVLLELSRRHRVALPADTVEGLREWFRFRDFAQFTEVMTALRPLVTSADDVELIAYEFARELARQRVRYAEVMITPAQLERRGVAWLDAVNRARRRASEDLGLELRWIVDVNRGLPEAERGYWADQALEAAIAGMDAGVVGFGLSGPEAGHPPEPFAPWFERARAAGLHSVPHAGEMAGPESVWGAVRALHAERIAHGARAVEDPVLVAHLAEHGIVLDLCPTSNVCLGVYRSLAEHPLRRLHQSGVPITVNSDDPTMFGTTLDHEIAALTGPLGLDHAAVPEIIANGFRFAFDPVAAA